MSLQPEQDERQGSGEPAGGALDDVDRMKPNTDRKGALAWMTQNSVAANLIMIGLIVGGILMFKNIRQEVFPEFELDMVIINVPYPGASPAEVEQGVVLAIEEGVRAIDGVKEIRGTASESVGVVTVELEEGTDRSRALADVKAAVDRITSFPEDIERPVVSLAQIRNQVISLILYGDKSELELRQLAEKTRDNLLALDGITQVELSGVRNYEISVEVPQESLRRYNITLDEVAQRIRRASVELPAGAVKTDRGEILLRTAERRLTGSEFGEIPILSRPDGTEVLLKDIGQVVDGFQETDRATFFNGKPAAVVQVYRVGDETPLEVSALVRDYVEGHEGSLPEGVGIATWSDRSEIYADRISLLLRNAWMGLILVLFTLGMFLELRLAFWVTMGIPISFVGSLLFLPVAGVSINMISLFAFIVTLGMVVDDAIVVGEAVYKYRQDGLGPMDAAIAGVREVAGPIVFAILTSCVAFSPLLFVPGTSGKFFGVIPMIVIIVLLISLVESLFVLPAHLAHSGTTTATGWRGALHHQQQRFARFVEWLIERTYVPSVRWAVTNRYTTAAICVALLIGTFGLIGGGRVGFTFMPRIESDNVSAELEMPFGTSFEETQAIERRIYTALEKTLEEVGEENLSRGQLSVVGASGVGGGHRGGRGSAGTHLAEVAMYMVPSDQRQIGAREFAQRWEENLGEVAGAESLTFDFSTGPGNSAPIAIELSHTDIDVLEEAATELAEEIALYDGTTQINDGFSEGKEQLDFKLKPEAQALGLTASDLGRQVRAAFYGAEAVRQQRGREEVRTYVRRPRNERESMHDLDNLLIRTPQGGEIPLAQAAEITRGRAYTSIRRVESRRVVTVTSDVKVQAQAAEVSAGLMADVLPRLAAKHEGLAFRSGGQQKERAESMGALKSGFLFAMIGIFGLLAVAFKSYIQPLIVMTAIPFGIIGAVGGHLLMGFDLSLISMMGVVALSGVVVNDSLILVDAANRFRSAYPGDQVGEAAVAAGARRFRPIILTSLTTFFGLAPMILETSVQARFLIPMAISLGFGVLFATFIILLLVPALYVMLEENKRRVARLLGREATHSAGDSHLDPVAGE